MSVPTLSFLHQDTLAAVVTNLTRRAARVPSLGASIPKVQRNRSATNCDQPVTAGQQHNILAACSSGSR